MRFNQIEKTILDIAIHVVPIAIIWLIFEPLGNGLFLALTKDFISQIYNYILNINLLKPYILIDYYSLDKYTTAILAGALIAYTWRFVRVGKLPKIILVVIALVGFLAYSFVVLKFFPSFGKAVVSIKQVVDSGVKFTVTSWVEALKLRVIPIFAAVNAVFIGTSLIFPTESIIALTLITTVVLLLISLALSYINRLVKRVCLYFESTVRNRVIVSFLSTIVCYVATSTIWGLLTLAGWVLLIYLIYLAVITLITKIATPVVLFSILISIVSSILAMIGLGFVIWLGWEFVKTSMKHVPKATPIVLLALPMIALHIVIFHEIVGLTVTAIMVIVPLTISIYINGRLNVSQLVETLITLFIMYNFADMVKPLSDIIVEFQEKFEVVKEVVKILREF